MQTRIWMNEQMLTGGRMALRLPVSASALLPLSLAGLLLTRP